MIKISEIPAEFQPGLALTLVHRKINSYKFVGHSTHSISRNKTTENLFYGVLARSLM